MRLVSRAFLACATLGCGKAAASTGLPVSRSNQLPAPAGSGSTVSPHPVRASFTGSRVATTTSSGARLNANACSAAANRW